MSDSPPSSYPYIPNSAPAIKQKMLAALGVSSMAELYAPIPADLRLDRPLNLPAPLLSEAALTRHVRGLLNQNTSAEECLSFLGAGCYQHHVPAVCDEINGRNEFLTAYSGRAYEDHGRFQALWEYASLMGELLNMDVVNLPLYDGYQAAATALRMAGRLTGRRRVILAGAFDPDKLSKIRDYCRSHLDLQVVGCEPGAGSLDLAAVRAALSDETAAVYFDNPNFLGALEARGAEISALAHARGALLVVGVEPLTLGVCAPPADYGADIACGDVQALGLHPQFGGGQAGFIAVPDEARFLMELPNRIVGLVPTVQPGEYGFGEIAFERTSYMTREQGKEFVGTTENLWGLTAGVYLALLGPRGLEELGESILARGQYAAQALGRLPGVRAPALAGPYFREFVVNFDATGRTVAHINQALLARQIFGGLDLSPLFPELGQSALYCVTEVHTQADLDRLTAVLAEVLA